MITTNWDDSPLSFEVEITRERPFDREELRVVEQWLFNQVDYRKLYIDPNDDVCESNVRLVGGEPKYLYLNCVFTNPTKLIYNGGIIGFSCTMECDSGFVWEDAVTYTFTNPSGQIKLSVDSDIPDYIYPTVVIQRGTATDIYITNQTDSSVRETAIYNIPSGSTITMNGRINRFTISGLDDPVAYNRFPGHKFIRLLKGDNILSVYTGEGSSAGTVGSIAFTWSNVRYW